MPNNYLSVLYKHIIQVENKNVGLKVCVCVGGAQTYHCPPPPSNKKVGVAQTYTCLPAPARPPPPRFQCIIINRHQCPKLTLTPNPIRLSRC